MFYGRIEITNQRLVVPILFITPLRLTPSWFDSYASELQSRWLLSQYTMPTCKLFLKYSESVKC